MTWDDWCGSSPASSRVFFAVKEDFFRILVFDLNQYYNSRCPASLGCSWDKHYMTIIKVAENSPAAMRVPKSSFRYFVPGNCGGPLLETDGVLLNPVEPSSLTFWLDIVTGKDKKIK